MKVIKSVWNIIIPSTILLFFPACSKSDRQKLSVDEIIKEHLATRFDIIDKSSKYIIPVRDRTIHRDPPGSTFMPGEYLDFKDLNGTSVPDNSSLNNLVVYTDFHVRKVQDFSDSHRFAWFIESPKPTGAGLNFVKKKSNQQFFDKILTCYRPLLEKGKPFVFAPVATAIDPNIDLEQIIQNKSKMTSIIASRKSRAPGHEKRHQAISRYYDKIDGIFGRAYKPIAANHDGILDYRYNIIFENRKEDFYFSEKLIDCLLCGTVPIYWGCPSIGKFFNPKGFICIKSVEELGGVLDHISEEDYKNRLDAIRENYKIAKEYIHFDKWLRIEIEKNN